MRQALTSSFFLKIKGPKGRERPRDRPIIFDRKAFLSRKKV